MILSVLRRLLGPARRRTRKWWRTATKLGRRGRVRLALRYVVRLIRADQSYFYQPVTIGGRTYEGFRDSAPRWDAISGQIQEYGVGSILDIGCAEAWLLRQAATEHGCFGLGVEGTHPRVLAGEVARLHDEAPRYAVIQAMLTPDDIRRLPVCDMVLCLSIVHHIIRQDGLDAGREFLRAAASRATRAVVFDMGTADEGEMRWTHQMPPMPDGQLAFLTALMKSVGISNVRQLTRTDGFGRTGERVLLIGEPDPGVGALS
jgi:hypothetical protein